MRTTVSDTRVSIDGVNTGTTAAFHPPGSDCVVKMLLSIACVAPAASVTLPTPGCHVSCSSVIISSGLGQLRKTLSSRPTPSPMAVKVAIAPDGRSSKYGVTGVSWPERSAEAGRTATTVSGAAMAYAGWIGRCTSSRSQESTSIAETLMDGCTMAFQPAGSDCSERMPWMSSSATASSKPNHSDSFPKNHSEEPGYLVPTSGTWAGRGIR